MKEATLGGTLWFGGWLFTIGFCAPGMVEGHPGHSGVAFLSGQPYRLGQPDTSPMGNLTPQGYRGPHTGQQMRWQSTAGCAGS